MVRMQSRTVRQKLPAERSAEFDHQGAQVIPLRRNTIGAQIRALLRREIISGQLPPRMMLSEQDLAARFRVSRTPIREALIKLSEESLVEIYPQYGSFVAPIKLGEVFDSQFVREALECAAIEKAVERISDDAARQLRATLDRQRAALRAQDQQGFFRSDEDMHAAIMTIAGHGTAWHYVENAKAQMDRVRFLSMTIPRKQSLVLAEHVAVVDNLLARNRRGAVEAMRVHLRGIFRSIEILVERADNYFVEENAGNANRPARAAPTEAKRRVRNSAKFRVK